MSGCGQGPGRAASVSGQGRRPHTCPYPLSQQPEREVLKLQGPGPPQAPPCPLSEGGDFSKVTERPYRAPTSLHPWWSELQEADTPRARPAALWEAAVPVPLWTSVSPEGCWGWAVPLTTENSGRPQPYKTWQMRSVSVRLFVTVHTVAKRLEGGQAEKGLPLHRNCTSCLVSPWGPAKWAGQHGWGN